MSLIRRKPKADTVSSPFIPLRDVALMLCLDESTIRKGKAGTDHFTLIRQGTGERQRIFLLKSEVEAHLAGLINYALEKKEQPVRLVYGT
jgi:hypothetical protein